MVAEAGHDDASFAQRNNAKPQTAIHTAQLPVLPRWRPRSGKTKEHTLMLDALKDAFRRSEFDPEAVEGGVLEL